MFVSQLLSIGVAFFEHANVRMPGRIDRALRLFIVTPDMHRIHHSQDIHEGESNFANMFSFWDRLFGTYVDQPAAGHDGIVFGVPDSRSETSDAALDARAAVSGATGTLSQSER